MDLLECFENNSTRAYERTGVFPFDPFAEAWTGAINGLGVGNEKCTTVSYEVVPAEEKMPALTPEEKKLLRTGLDLDDQNDLGDWYCAEIQASIILGKWWGDVEKGVSEGKDVSEYSKLHLPASFATTECEKLVVSLINFEPIDVSKIPLPAPKSTEERGKEISKMIVELTKIARPIRISYLLEESTNGTGPLDSSMGICRLEGTAIKGKNAKWSLTIENGDTMSHTSEEMLSLPSIFIQNAYTELDANERKRTISKKRRIQKTETKKKEKEYIKLARVKQEEEEKKEFETILERVEGGVWEFSDFKALVKRMREPFSCDVDGVNVQVTPDDAAVMFDRASLDAVRRVLVLDGGDKNNNEGGDGQPARKRQRKNTAAATTTFGLGCNEAHYQTDRRDRSQNAIAIATKLKEDLKEKDAIVELLTVFDKRKKLYVEAVRTWREGGYDAPCPRLPFWVCQERDKGAFRLFLRMFLPKYGHGYLGKPAADQWDCIQTKIAGTLDLTESSVNAKAEELRRRLRTVEQAIRDAQSIQGDPDPN